MIRGTITPFIFKVPENFGSVNQIRVIFWQPGYEGTVVGPLPLAKYYDNLATVTRNDGFSISSESISVALTPNETLRFSDEVKGYVQMQIYNRVEGKTWASIPKRFTVYPIRSGNIFEDPIITPAGDDILYIDAGEI